MGLPVPPTRGLLRLGPAGPFPRSSHPAWFFSGDGPIRLLDLAGYRQAMIDAGLARNLAVDAVQRMALHGTGEVLWAGAQGGKRGHFHSSWEVRVFTTRMPAEKALPSLTGLGGLPLGATAVEALAVRPGVVLSYTGTCEPSVLRLPSEHGPRWSRALRIPAQIRCHYNRVAHASLAVGNVCAQITLLTESLPRAEHGLRSLVELVLRDLEEHDTPATA